MQLGQLFQNLSYGELSSLGLSEEGSGTITLTDQPKVLAHVNAALVKISQTVAYKICYVTLAAEAARKDYYLASIHAASNTDVGNTAPRYLLDTADDPFLDNVIKIREITRLDREDTPEIDETRLTPINRRVTNSGFGSRVMGTTRITLEQPLDGDQYKIEFQAMAQKLATVPNLTEVLDIPVVLETALELNVAARVFGAIGNELAVLKSRELWQRYNQELSDLKLDDSLNESETDGYDRLRDKGFV